MTEPRLKALLQSAAVASAGAGGGNQSASSPTATSTGRTITLLGNNPAEVTVGANFVDPGAIAKASDGTSLMPDIATSTVNTAIAGSYEVVWVVHDSAMNWATSTRTVIVSAPAASGTATTVAQCLFWAYVCRLCQVFLYVRKKLSYLTVAVRFGVHIL